MANVTSNATCNFTTIGNATSLQGYNCINATVSLTNSSNLPTNSILNASAASHLKAAMILLSSSSILPINSSILQTNSASNASTASHFTATLYQLANSSILQTNSSILPTNSTAKTSTPSNFTTTAKIFGYMFYGLLFLFGVSGNSIVFYVIGYRKKKRTSSDIFILSLACADFLASIFVPMIMVNDLFTDLNGWYYGKAMCYVFPAVSPATLTASAWSLVFISFDRYRIIAKPMAPRPSRSIIYVIVLLIWTGSAAATIPYALRLGLYDNACTEVNSTIVPNQPYVIFMGFLLALNTIIPGLLIGVVYWLTARALKRNTLQHVNNLAMLKRNKENALIVRMFIIIIIIFVVLTMPYAFYYFFFTYWFYYLPFNRKDFRFLSTLNYYLFITAAANSCVNPLIYAKMHKEINNFLKSVARQLCKPVARTMPGHSAAYTVSSTFSVQTQETNQSSI